MAIDLDSIENLVRSGKRLFPLWADDGYLISRVTEGGCFLPNTPVERHRKILDNDTNRRRHSFIHVLESFTVAVAE
jgi:hypothetical protein